MLTVTRLTIRKLDTYYVRAVINLFRLFATKTFDCELIVRKSLKWEFNKLDKPDKDIMLTFPSKTLMGGVNKEQYYGLLMEIWLDCKIVVPLTERDLKCYEWITIICKLRCYLYNYNVINSSYKEKRTTVIFTCCFLSFRSILKTKPTWDTLEDTKRKIIYSV